MTQTTPSFDFYRLGFAFFFSGWFEIDFKYRSSKKEMVHMYRFRNRLCFAIYVAQTQGYNHWIGLALGATSVPLLLAVVHESGLGGSYLGI